MGSKTQYGYPELAHKPGNSRTGKLWMDGWPSEVMFFSPWVSACKTAAMDHCLTQNNDGSRQKECGAVMETAMPGAVRQAASNCKLWELCLVLGMLFVLLYINGCVQLLNGLATRNQIGVWPRPSLYFSWLLVSRGSWTCLTTLLPGDYTDSEFFT